MPKHMSIFCSQDCFKAAWSAHKQLHKPGENSWMYVLDNGQSRAASCPHFSWTGPLRPYRCVHSQDTLTLPTTTVQHEWQ
jgi:methionyl aminopeptidase